MSSVFIRLCYRYNYKFPYLDHDTGIEVTESDFELKKAKELHALSCFTTADDTMDELQRTSNSDSTLSNSGSS